MQIDKLSVMVSSGTRYERDRLLFYNALADAVITDAIPPGVIQLATGAWFDPLDPATIGSLDKHGNPNMLTLDKGTSRLAQCCSAQTALVELERFTGMLPEITVFSPPQVVTLAVL